VTFQVVDTLSVGFIEYYLMIQMQSLDHSLLFAVCQSLLLVV